MIISNIEKYTNGWFIGNFEPSLLKTTNVEVACHNFKNGSKSIPHTHKIAMEYNYIVNGTLIASGRELKTGDIFIYEPNDIADVLFVQDTNLVVIKIPSVPDDKYNATINNIWSHQNNVFSKNGEDGIISYIFKKIEQYSITYSKICVDIGTCNGVYNSNSRALIADGWRSLQVDNKQYIDIINNYKDNQNIICLNTMATPTGVLSYDELVYKHFPEETIGIVNIAVGYNDFDIFQNIKSNPLVILVWNNSHRNKFKKEGMTTFVKTAKNMGYELVCCMWNLFFLRKDLIRYLGYPIVTPEEAWNTFLMNIPEGKGANLWSIMPSNFWDR